jgi:hypothetical protein
MLKLQTNPKLMLDSKTHSKHLRALNEVCRILVPHVAFGCTLNAAEKKVGIQLSIYPTATLTFVILKMLAENFGSARIHKERETKKSQKH